MEQKKTFTLKDYETNRAQFSCEVGLATLCQEFADTESIIAREYLDKYLTTNDPADKVKKEEHLKRERAELKKSRKHKKIAAVLQQNCAKILLYLTSDALAEVLKRYAGKSCGMQTRRKIEVELTAAIRAEGLTRLDAYLLKPCEGEAGGSIKLQEHATAPQYWSATNITIYAHSQIIDSNNKIIDPAEGREGSEPFYTYNDGGRDFIEYRDIEKRLQADADKRAEIQADADALREKIKNYNSGRALDNELLPQIRNFLIFD